MRCDGMGSGAAVGVLEPGAEGGEPCAGSALAQAVKVCQSCPVYLAMWCRAMRCVRGKWDTAATGRNCHKIAGMVGKHRERQKK